MTAGELHILISYRDSLKIFFEENEFSQVVTMNIAHEIKHLDKRIHQLTKEPDKYYYESKIIIPSFINRYRTRKIIKNGETKKTK